MSQSAVPNSDVATGLWTPTPVYPQIRQLLTGDPNFVTSSQDPTSDTFIVKLSGVAWPAAGPEVLKIRLQNTTSSLVIATISLFDGSTLIGTWTVQPPMGFTTYKLPLTAGQIAAITNYANLEVQVTAGTINVCGCTGLPFTLYVYVTNVSRCACLAGQYKMTYSGGGWSNLNGPDSSPCYTPTYFVLACVSGKWQLTIDCMGGNIAQASSVSCSPFQLQFNGMAITNLCCPGGTINVLVTG